MATKIKIPESRRKYQLIVGPTKGLNTYDPSTTIDSKETPRCHEVSMKEGVVASKFGWTPFASTDLSTRLRCRVTVSPAFGSTNLVSTVTVTS